MSGIHINVSQERILERLKGLNYPASKQDLIDHAVNGIEEETDDVVDAVESLPKQTFESEEELRREIEQRQK